MGRKTREAVSCLSLAGVSKSLTNDHPAEGLRLLTQRRLGAERPVRVQHVRTQPCQTATLLL